MKGDGPSHRIERALKRSMDVAASLCALVLLSPVLGAIALAIKLDSPGGVIYCHQRIGKDGRPFNLYKFRSMVTGGDDTEYVQYLKKLIASGQNGADHGLPYRKMDIDPRITRTGQFLRCHYLDELPQLVNILKGEMSLVGPRPHVQFEVDHYTEAQRRRLSVVPGATGLWQVKGKADCTFCELIQLDLDYIDRWSLGLDLEILFTTMVIVLRGGEGFWARMAKQIPQRKREPSIQPEFVETPALIPSGEPVEEPMFAENQWFLEYSEAHMLEEANDGGGEGWGDRRRILGTEPDSQLVSVARSSTGDGMRP